MAQYKAFSPDVKIHGQTILTVVDDALTRFSPEYRRQARETLADNSITDPTSEEWYPQQAWLNTFELLAERLEPHILDRLVSGVEEGLQSIDTAYRRNHQGGDIGSYRFEKIDGQTGDM